MKAIGSAFRSSLAAKVENQGIGGEGETIQMSVVGETGPMRVLGLEPRTYALKVRCSAD